MGRVAFVLPDAVVWLLKMSMWETNVLYKTPPGMNDDWFWMHAALKYKTLVVTNDEMRDHHFQMLAPKFFLRWKERHQIHFDFGTWIPLVRRANHTNEDNNDNSSFCNSKGRNNKRRRRQQRE